MKVFFESLIDHEWDDARPSGISYFTQPAMLPTLGIVFEDDWWARSMFATWHRRLGQEDIYGELRISIIEEFVSTEGLGYSVCISSDPYQTAIRKKTEGKGMQLEVDTNISLSRSLRQPLDSGHLAAFRCFQRAYAGCKQYRIIPVINGNVPLFHIALSKREIFFPRRL